MKPGVAAGDAERRRERRSRLAGRLSRRAVVKMLSVMEQAGDPVQEFLTSGRTGRRNALPDILGEHAATTTADLSHCLQKLSTAELDARAAASNAEAGAAGATSTATTNGAGPSQGTSAEGPNMGQTGSGVHS